jgi:mRNA interferase MazF
MSQPTSEPTVEPQRGEVWRVEFEPSRGAEIRKTRPAVVVNVATAGKLPLRVIVPLTGWQPAFARVFWMVKIEPDATNGLDKDSAADGFQVRSLSVARFTRKIGVLTAEQMDAIARAVSEVVGAPQSP